MRMSTFLSQNNLVRAAKIIDRVDRVKIVYVIILQVLFGLLDLVGVGIVGVLGAISVSGVQGRTPGDRSSQILRLLNIEGFSLQYQVGILGLLAAGLLIAKTIFSIIFARKIMFFLSRRGAIISSRMIRKILNLNLVKIQERSNQETLYYSTYGVTAITLGIIGISVNVISDLSLLLVLSVGLFIVDPLIAFATVITFSLIGTYLYLMMHIRARKLGAESSRLNIASNEKILEVLGSYRESVVRGRRSFYAAQIGRQRLNLSNTQAELTFMPSISKYVIEITVVIGMLAIGALQFALQDVGRAVGVLSVFLAASTRIAPAVLRVQQGAVQINGNLGLAEPTLKLIEELNDVSEADSDSSISDFTHTGFEANVDLSQVSFGYSTGAPSTIKDISLQIKQGKSIAIVGPSGSGKTTLVDVILGVLVPSAGRVLISGSNPRDAIKTWPGAIAYVPQDVLIINGSIKENIAMGFDQENVNHEDVWKALDAAQLKSFVAGLNGGLDAQVGDRGTRLSGGQRQRLGIARAMYTNPKLLVLDEATSSLDGQTESDLADSLHELSGKVTVIMIAHRLSSVRHVDHLIYLEDGAIKSQGNFEQVRSEVPNFDRQANLMGL